MCAQCAPSNFVFPYNPRRVLAYVINGVFVEVVLPDAYTLQELRALYRAVLDDPALPQRALMLFDARQRVSQVSFEERRARTAAFLEILPPRIPPVCAMVATPQAALTAKAAQLEAGVTGLRVGIFSDMDSARRWLGVYAR